MDGRKPVGGKLEVKVRVRNPIHTKQVEQVQEKWLVIDHFQ
jgi:coiled-coil and C2 domain-containing protein 1